MDLVKADALLWKSFMFVNSCMQHKCMSLQFKVVKCICRSRTDMLEPTMGFYSVTRLVLIYAVEVAC